MNTTKYTTTATKINTASVAFRFGVEAAQRDEACVPETIFIARKDQINFAAGFESISGITEVTAQFTGSALPTATPAKAHNWHDHNAKRAIAAVEAQQRQMRRAYEMTAEFMGGIYEGDILFIAA